jgi:hypothetical protein
MEYVMAIWELMQQSVILGVVISDRKGRGCMVKILEGLCMINRINGGK